MSCQVAASKSLNIFHIDLKAAFLQGRSYGVNRNVVCKLPPQASHPPYIAARSKKPTYDINDAPRRLCNTLDKALCNYGMVPTRVDRCCCVWYSTQAREPNWNQKCSTQRHGNNDISFESRVRSQRVAAFEKMLDPIEGSPAKGKSLARIIFLFVDDLLGTGATEMEQRVPARLGKDFQVGSEDWNVVLFTKQ